MIQIDFQNIKARNRWKNFSIILMTHKMRQNINAIKIIF